MDNQSFLATIIALIPLALGISWNFVRLPFSNIKIINSAVILVAGVLLILSGESEPVTRFLATVVLLSAFSVMLCLEETQQDSDNISSSMVILGLTLGILLSQEFVSKLFLCGALGYAAFSLIKEKKRSFRTTLIIIHFIIAFTLSLISSLGNESLQIISGLFLAITFIPLVPFHLPFVGIIESNKGTLSSFWIVVWLAIGLAQLNSIHSSLSGEILYFIGWLSLISAIYASLAALGQLKSNLFVAAATVAHASLIWGLINVFPNFPKWGVAFGAALAFVLGGISLAFSFVRQRYGWQTLGKLPGLASKMPKFGTAMALLVSFALFLPMVPLFTGLITMPTIETANIEFTKLFIIFLAVWLGGGWFLLKMLHQTAFGTPRNDVPYSDLRLNEYVALTAFLLGAGYSGLLY